MRIYDVNFAHIKHGANFSRRRVAVRGFVEQAIKKALTAPDIKAYKSQLRVESVELVASA